MIKLMRRIKLLWIVLFWFFATTPALSAIITHDISTARLTIPGTSTDDYVITGSTTANYVDVETGYRGSITLRNCTIELTVVAHSPIRVHGQDNLSNLTPITNVKIILNGNNRLYHNGTGGSDKPNGWAALQVDQGAQINISAVNPYDDTSGILEAIIGYTSGGAAIGALANNSTGEARGSATLSCGGSGPTAGGNIVISSGTVTAKGGHGAGIGGGFRTYYDGMIVIYGGIVDSQAGSHAAGIGSGCPTNTGVVNCYTPNSAIIVLPPAQITAFGAISYGSPFADWALAGSNNIVYIGDPAKPQVTVRTEDFEPNANIYVDLSRNPAIASVVNAIIPSNELDINKVKFGQTNSSGIYSFNGILNDSTTFFTDASSSQPATLGRPYLPEKVTLPNGGMVILRLLDTDLALLPFPSKALDEGYSTLDAFNNAYRVRLIYNDDNDMDNVVFDLANGLTSDFVPIRFFTTNKTEIIAPNKLVKGDTIDMIIPIKDLKPIGLYADVLRIIGEISGVSTGYIRQVINQVVAKLTLYETICNGDSVFFNNEYQKQTGVYVEFLQDVVGMDSIVALNLTVHPSYNDTLKVELCQKDSVFFDGRYYSNAGYYSNAYTTINGCDSVLNLQIAVYPIFNDTTYTEIYTSESVLFGGKYYSIQGIYTDSLKTIFGCDSLSTLHLTVHPTFDFQPIETGDICGDDFSFNIDFEELFGIVDYYSLAFDAKALAAGFSDVTLAPFTNPMIVSLPQNVRPDHYSVNIKLKNTAKYKQEFTIEFTVKYPSSVMAQKWNDVIALYNSTYNGGYDFSAIQWYKNGNMLYGENHSYLYLENSQFSAGDEYSALLTRSDDGESVFTCPLTVVVRALSTQVYPTMLSAGETINIISPKTAKVSIYNSLGILSGEQTINAGNMEITAPNRAGVYFLIVSDVDRVLHKQTIVVK